MLEQVQGIPRVLIHLRLSDLLLMTFVMGGISCGGSQQVLVSNMQIFVSTIKTSLISGEKRDVHPHVH